MRNQFTRLLEASTTRIAGGCLIFTTRKTKAPFVNPTVSLVVTICMGARTTSVMTALVTVPAALDTTALYPPLWLVEILGMEYVWKVAPSILVPLNLHW